MSEKRLAGGKVVRGLRFAFILSVVSAVRRWAGRVLGCRVLAKLSSIVSFSVLGDSGGFFAILRAEVAAGRGVVGGLGGAGGDGFKGAFCPKAAHSLRGSRSPLMFPLGCEFDPELLGGAAEQVETAPDR